MRIDVDLDAQALYLKLTNEPIAATREIDDITVVDVDRDGHLVGIEVLALDRPWPIDMVLNRYPLSDQRRANLRAYFMADSLARLA